ncbi:cell wall surface anchored protein [Rhodotorula toruloides]|uniref:Cell wall surface anchored protein n=1 Tax=Rhodotorula toruloides TaxID=5286 RepID=A0A511KJQ8_RHOTO|nr:cell wall surface anchored protein [Rhodotorula toruloides]
MPSLELLGIHVDASDDRAMVATEFSSNDGTRLLLSQLVLLLPPEEDQAERICVDVVALTDPLHLLRLSIFNIRTETELWSSASFSNLRSLRPYSHIGDFLADLLDFFVQLSCLRKLDLYNYRPSRLEPCKDSLVQSVLRTFPPSLVEGCLERLLFPLSEQQYLKHVPAADAPGEARFFCFMVYKKEAVSPFVMIKILIEGQHDKAATVPSADAADDES